MDGFGWTFFFCFIFRCSSLFRFFDSMHFVLSLPPLHTLTYIHTPYLRLTTRPHDAPYREIKRTDGISPSKLIYIDYTLTTSIVTYASHLMFSSSHILLIAYIHPISVLLLHLHLHLIFT
ncbi:hypothetical protein BJ165DRAFT_139750 [Panaeolus papilionaceus]|nr:hypothetical protein BJ165DRAFT_139750 [Panaeolus papilionaceus]